MENKEDCQHSSIVLSLGVRGYRDEKITQPHRKEDILGSTVIGKNRILGHEDTHG